MYTTVSVIVPTYLRPPDLLRCLQAFRSQTRPADEVVVVVRDTDRLTLEALQREQRRLPHFELVTVSRPGQVAAMAAGASAATGAVLAFIDDDTKPRPEWLQRLTLHYADPKVVGVGGRDVVASNPDLPQRVVRLITWYGRIVGNHHVGVGPPRRVHLLKGANMSFRREAVLVPHGLLGNGAESHNDLAISFCGPQARHSHL